MPAVESNGFVDCFGRRCYRLRGHDRLPPFLMNLVSASDLWAFVASNGALTAGRRDSDHALFGYLPVDRLYDSARQQGPFTACWVETASGPVLWEPLSVSPAKPTSCECAIYKSVEGDAIWFEERRSQLSLVFRYGWMTSARHGMVRIAELHNESSEERSVEILDGLRNLLMPGVTRRLQEELSCLTDAYKMAERVEELPLAVFALASGVTDRPEPLEVLRATTVWSEGLPEANVLLSDRQLERFYERQAIEAESRARGQRASYLLHAAVQLAPGERRRWLMVADYGLSPANVEALSVAVRAGGLAQAVELTCQETSERLRRLVARADGLEVTGDETAAVHHFANVLFNCARGGIPADDAVVHRDEFREYVEKRSRRLASAAARSIQQWPEVVPWRQLQALAAGCGDLDLERLALEYLPLTFSRRHGDPSRPWNRFRLRAEEDGRRVLHYEGNWRDVFQNWEALALSFPDFLESMIARFVNSSTRDGYNPYRISRDGVDWEVPNPEDPWASIGYWGDHQVIYLLKLLEWSERFHPRLLAAWLSAERFVFAESPYRLYSYEEMRKNPRATIRFDAEAYRLMEQRMEAEGTDGQLLRTRSGALVRVSFLEKLLLVALVRLGSFVPGAGIWLNTQRPEWNDGNNALAGSGASVVTLGYLRRFLRHLGEVVLRSLGDEPVRLTEPTAQLVYAIADVLRKAGGGVGARDLSPADTRGVLDGLGAAMSAYRETVYENGSLAWKEVSAAAVRELIETARLWVEHTLRQNRRQDGLYHAYNTVRFVESPPSVQCQRLPLMLEGQVSILSSGMLSGGEAVGLLDALRDSALYRPDQDSYLLHPTRDLPGFLKRGVLPDAAAQPTGWLQRWIQEPAGRLFERGAGGSSRLRFHPDLVSRERLEERLDVLARSPAHAAALREDRPRLLALYEEVYQHATYVGRSGAMFAYEGLGSIYWHMVAKLLLATQEVAEVARRENSPWWPALEAHYVQIRGGLGAAKTPEQFGAFPTDPYSHTPEQRGAQQPGMTGQVKEEIIARWVERGIDVREGRLGFVLERLQQLSPAADGGSLLRLEAGRGERVVVPPGSVGFSVCGTPVLVQARVGVRLMLRLHWADGRVSERATLRLDREESDAVFARTGRLLRLEIELPSNSASA